MTVLRHLLPLALLAAAATTRVVAADVDDANANLWMSYIAVSYTHLTLPTNREV